MLSVNAMSGFGAKATFTTTTASTSDSWTFSTSSFTFTGADVICTSNDKAIYTTTSFTGDFEISYKFRSDVALLSFIGLFKTADTGSFANSWPLGMSGWYWNKHGGAYNQLGDYQTITIPMTSSSTPTVTDGEYVIWKRVGSTISVIVDGATVDTLATTSSDALRFFIMQGGGSAGHIQDVSFTE